MKKEEINKFMRQLDDLLPVLIENFHILRIPKGFKEKITTQQYRVLNILTKKRKCMIGELSQYCNVARSTMTELIDRMVNKNLVKRLKDVKDNRRIIISLTNIGGELVSKINSERRKRVKNILKKLGKSRRDSFINALKEMFKIANEQEILKGGLK